jgi:DNA-binding NarL/FixJ family response regulator
MSLVRGVPEQNARSLKPTESLSVMLIDHSPAFRAGLRQAIERVRDMRVVCELAQGETVFEPGFHFEADVAVIDADLPDRSCIEVGHRLITQRPELVVLLLSDADWDVYLVAARAARAGGLLLRASEPAELTWAIRQAASAPIFSPEQIERVQRWSQVLGVRLRTLAPREWEVLWLVSEGLSNGDISKKLSLTDNTVEKHIGSIYEKLGLHSRGKLLALILAEHIEVISRLARGTGPLQFV